MYVRLYVTFLSLLCLGIFPYAQDVKDAEDAPAFLKEMEQKASEIASKEAKWMRRDFTQAFESDVVGDDRRQQFMKLVRFLESNRTKFRTGILGYFRVGAFAPTRLEDLGRLARSIGVFQDLPQRTKSV